MKIGSNQSMLGFKVIGRRESFRRDRLFFVKIQQGFKSYSTESTDDIYGQTQEILTDIL